MARPALPQGYGGWQILYPSASEGGRGKIWGWAQDHHGLDRAAWTEEVPLPQRGKTLQRGSAWPKTGKVERMVVAGRMLTRCQWAQGDKSVSHLGPRLWGDWPHLRAMGMSPEPLGKAEELMRAGSGAGSGACNVGLLRFWIWMKRVSR